MKWIVAGLVVIVIGTLVYLSAMFTGPRMRVQQHVRAYQKSMPHPPPNTVPVGPDRYAVPPPREASGLKNPLPENKASRDRGKIYYSYYCVFCHGENGQGDGPVGYSYMPVPTDLHAPKIVKMSDGDLLRAILLGIGHEPVLQRVVLPEHRWYLVTYTRALGQTPREPTQDPGKLVVPQNPGSQRR